jgi:hypothetical protein
VSPDQPKRYNPGRDVLTGVSWAGSVVVMTASAAYLSALTPAMTTRWIAFGAFLISLTTMITLRGGWFRRLRSRSYPRPDQPARGNADDPPEPATLAAEPALQEEGALPC